MKCQHQHPPWLHHFLCIHSKYKTNIFFPWWLLNILPQQCSFPAFYLHLSIHYLASESPFSTQKESSCAWVTWMSHSILCYLFSNLPLLWLGKAVERWWFLLPLSLGILIKLNISPRREKIKLLICHLVMHEANILFLLCYKSLK